MVFWHCSVQTIRRWKMIFLVVVVVFIIPPPPFSGADDWLNGLWDERAETCRLCIEQKISFLRMSIVIAYLAFVNIVS